VLTGLCLLEISSRSKSINQTEGNRKFSESEEPTTRIGSRLWVKHGKVSVTFFSELILKDCNFPCWRKL